MIKVIQYGHRWAVIDTSRKDEPVILSLHPGEEVARAAAADLMRARLAG